MSGIAGIVDLLGGQSLPSAALRQMAHALDHRGPDAEGFHENAGVGLAWRGLKTNTIPEQQPFVSAEHMVAAVCQGELFNAQQLREMVQARGHMLRTNSTAELIAYLWLDHGADLLERLRGQFAFALWDRRQRCLMLARDRVGITPLYWAQRGNLLLFASEIKALLASGLVRAEVDRRGLDHVFTFMGTPAARTCFLNVQALLPGHYLIAQLSDKAAVPRVQRYWDLDFPDCGDERDGATEKLTDELQNKLQTAVANRMRPGETVASYVSGGIDCSTIAALAAKASGSAIPTFTIRLDLAHLDESERALRAARASGSEPVIIACDVRKIVETFPRVIRATEYPTPDTSCSALLLAAECVRQHGFNIALAGDGADDLFAGYPWFKIDRMLSIFDWLPGIRPSQWLRRAYLKLTSPHIPWSNVRRIQSLAGGHHAWLDLYGLVSMSRTRFYSADMHDALNGHIAYEDLSLNLERMKHWHPLNQDLYLGTNVHLPGLQLLAKGDRIAMAASVQTRFPFLDEDVVAFSASLHPHWKLRRLRDKYLLRQVAARWLPADIAKRPKSDFVAPFDSLYGDNAPPYVEHLLSEESLRRTGYFDPKAVYTWRHAYRSLRAQSGKRISVEIGLASVVATQLWHHTFIDASLADLPSLCFVRRPS